MSFLFIEQSAVSDDSLRAFCKIFVNSEVSHINVYVEELVVFIECGRNHLSTVTWHVLVLHPWPLNQYVPSVTSYWDTGKYDRSQ